MVRLTARQRSGLAETFREVANYGVAALVFGQFVGGTSLSWSRVLAGVMLWIALVTFAIVLDGD